MPYTAAYAAEEPTRAAIGRHSGATVLEFGAPWCGHCMGAQPAIASALSARDSVRHVKIEDGRGRPLGRSYRIKLWPTLVFLRDGEEIARLVRPQSRNDIDDALSRL